jgi:hypothetical protein
MRTLIHRGPISRGYVTWIVLRPLIASMATLALNSGLWVRRLLIGGSPVQGQYPQGLLEVTPMAVPSQVPSTPATSEAV